MIALLGEDVRARFFVIVIAVAVVCVLNAKASQHGRVAQFPPAKFISIVKIKRKVITFSAISAIRQKHWPKHTQTHTEPSYHGTQSKR